MIRMELKGVDRLDEKVRSICSRMHDSALNGAQTAAEDTRKIAVRLAHGGVLKRSIKAEVVEIETGNVVAARVFNDTSKAFWSSYVEFGTGLHVDNEGITDAIRLKRAKKIPWYIHVSMVPQSFEKYGYPRVGDFYEVDGMYPQPYMKPAGFERRQANLQEVANEIKKMLEEVGI